MPKAGSLINTEETYIWVEGLLPGEPTIARRKLGDSFPEFAMAQLLLGSPETGDAETVAMTLDASRIDPALETEDGSALRVELLTVVEGHGGVAADLLAHAATMISEGPHDRPPKPGTLLPNVAQGVEGVTARHGLLVVPFVWDEGVPHVHEVAHESRGRHAKQSDGPAEAELTHPGRLTVAAQLVMLNDEELDIARKQGIEAVQAHLVQHGINLNNVYR